MPKQCRGAGYAATDLWDFLCVKRNYEAFAKDRNLNSINITNGITVDKDKLLHNGHGLKGVGMNYFFIPAEKTNP